MKIMSDTRKVFTSLASTLPTVSKDSPRIKKILPKVRLFAQIQSDVQETLIAAAIPSRFDAGQVIYLEGEPAEYIFIIESGWVKATRISREGREQALLFLHPGEIFGDIAVFSHTTYPGTVTALEAVMPR